MPIWRREFLKQAGSLGAAPTLFSAGLQSKATGPRRFSGSHLNRISFPLGGVAAGSIGLGGHGELRDWQVFNRPDYGNAPSYAFGAMWVQRSNEPPLARVLETSSAPPFDGPRGMGAKNAPGLPRLESCEFEAEFPIANVIFLDRNLPVKVNLQAFSPFIPLEAEDSGLPVAILRYEVSNPGRLSVKVSIAFSLENPVGDGLRSNEPVQDAALTGLSMTNASLAKNDPLYGSFALCAIRDGATVASVLPGWDSDSHWRVGAQHFWDAFSRTGELPAPTATAGPVGSIALRGEIAPGAKKSFTFLLSWHFPNRTPSRCGWQAPKGDENTVIGNHYCVRFENAWKAARDTAARLPDLERRTQRFVATMRDSSIPDVFREAALANLSTLVSPGCFRTADGSFNGFEGCNEQSGAWFGNCTHVWNYEFATAFLFPSLSQSMRESAFGFGTDAVGKMDLRKSLPTGKEHFPYAAADGQMGQIVRLCLDWKLSGNTAWLKQQLPAARRALEFAWKRGGWDADHDGVMEGVQHNTYDIEFFGPNPLCSVWYLGALRAMEEMTLAAGDVTASREYRTLFEKGSRWLDGNLFTGDYYAQRVRGIPKREIADGLLSGLGAADTEHPTFQPGSGCLTDQLVGQYAAYAAGLGPLLDRQHVRRALRSIYQNNYKRRIGDVPAVDRVFALNDESAVVLCSYPEDPPTGRFPRFSEIWSGVEYSLAALMLFEGMIAPATEIVRSVRQRYDGERRNPWAEIEAGWHYVRAMASWTCIVALSGFSYDGGAKKITLRPPAAGKQFKCIWLSATGWGSFELRQNIAGPFLRISVEAGKIACRSLTIPTPSTRTVIQARLGTAILPPKVTHEEDRTRLEFDRDIEINQQAPLVLLTP